MAFFSGTISSASLGLDTNINVILPQNPSPGVPTRVLYLLHGIYANHTAWTRYTRAESYANAKGFAVIMPDGGRSLYADMRHGGAYFSYITEELPQICKKLFGFSGKPEDTFIAGLSMGGYGALKSVFAKPENYRAAASFSGPCDMLDKAASDLLDSLPEKEAIFGQGGQMADADNLFLLSSQAGAKNIKPPLFISCGLRDPFIGSNRRLTDHIKTLGFPVEYKEWDDGHTWDFWDKSLMLALNFFDGL